MSTNTKNPSSSRLELQASSDLLAFYKSRIEEFEQERQSFLERVEQVSVQASAIHKLEWENQRRADEIRELQKALSDAHTYLFEERQRLLALQADNDELRLQELADRKRIQQLLGVAAPTEQEIKYDRGRPPTSITLFPGGSPRGRANQSTEGQDGPQRVMRTVFLPTQQADFLLLKVESLQAQLNEQVQLASERVSALLEDRQIRSAEEDAHRSLLTQQVEELRVKLRKTEEALRLATKESILARRERQSAELRAAAAEGECERERREHTQALAAMEEKIEDVTRGVKEEAEARVEDVAENLRSQLRAAEDELMHLTSQHANMRAQYDKKVLELEGKVIKLADAHKAIEARRVMDVEGFSADVTAIRRQLGLVERKLHQMRLEDRLVDDDRLDILISRLQVKEQAVGAGRRASTAGARDGSSAKGDFAGELRAVRGKLTSLEEKVHTVKKTLKGR